MKGPVIAKEIVKDVLKKYGLDLETYTLFEVWEKELGPVAKKIKLMGRNKKCFLVQIESPAYRQELRYRKKEFIRKINDYFNKNIIDDIKEVK